LVQAFLKKWWVESDFKEPNLPPNKQTAKIREVARVLGLIVSSFSAVDHARLYYREIEKAKFIALIESCGNFDAPMKITSNMREELNWWFTNVYKQKRVIR
jgi:hypothetical protein